MKTSASPVDPRVFMLDCKRVKSTMGFQWPRHQRNLKVLAHQWIDSFRKPSECKVTGDSKVDYCNRRVYKWQSKEKFYLVSRRPAVMWKRYKTARKKIKISLLFDLKVFEQKPQNFRFEVPFSCLDLKLSLTRSFPVKAGVMGILQGLLEYLENEVRMRLNLGDVLVNYRAELEQKYKILKRIERTKCPVHEASRELYYDATDSDSNCSDDEQCNNRVLDLTKKHSDRKNPEKQLRTIIQELTEDSRQLDKDIAVLEFQERDYLELLDDYESVNVEIEEAKYEYKFYHNDLKKQMKRYNSHVRYLKDITLLSKVSYFIAVAEKIQCEWQYVKATTNIVMKLKKKFSALTSERSKKDLDKLLNKIVHHRRKLLENHEIMKERHRNFNVKLNYLQQRILAEPVDRVIQTVKLFDLHKDVSVDVTCTMFEVINKHYMLHIDHELIVTVRSVLETLLQTKHASPSLIACMHRKLDQRRNLSSVIDDLRWAKAASGFQYGINMYSIDKRIISDRFELYPDKKAWGMYS